MAGPTDAGEPVDVIVDDEGVWTTATRDGRGRLRSIPGSTGVSRTRVWPVPVDQHFPGWLADVAQGPVTGRTLSLARLTATTMRAAENRSVPVVRGQRWGWRCAPDPKLASRLAEAVTQCIEMGLATTVEPQVTIDELCVTITTAHIGASITDVPALLPSGTQASARRWADHVVARSCGNARLALLLQPPSETAHHWSLEALTIRLDEPTTRLPWQTADPQMFGATAQAWATFQHTEITALRSCWGSRWLPEMVDRLLLGPVILDDEDILVFLDRIATKVQDAGFDVIVPGGLLRTARVRRRLSTTASGMGTLHVHGLALEASVEVDGMPLTQEDLIALAAAKSELVSVGGRWLRISASDADRLTALARRLRRPVTPTDLLTDEAFDGVEVDAGSLLPAGLRPARPVHPSPAVQATLRHYQITGVQWLTWLADNGVGGVLADDMGLGKTLQVLSWIQADHDGPTLVVCPVTLVDTWARQAAAFTPDLRVQTFHGGQRADVDLRADIVVTTYGLLARDDLLKDVLWHRVVLDEAQAIKNPDTHAARAARALTATHRLAVTGTPVENHLGDLWSLFAFAQPGLLPRRKAFNQRFLNAEEADLARLRAVVSPFILRRLKTDPGILPDLPDREVIRDDCTMTREQIGAYEAVVKDLLGALDELRAAAGSAADPRLRRRATVLASISRLKQICVHPALLTESRRHLGNRSGKVTRLVDLCGQITDEGQAVVVFTQFASFVPDLASHLSAELGVEVATLTGADSRTARSATVATFSQSEGPPILVASLKAGGTGLTLVRANHVIHLDRWWNPAVEDQASDRVWRIGQNQKVSVHTLVCPGTLEERIDEALRAKRALASRVIASTETAVTELSDEELTSLVQLVRGEVLQ